MDHYVSPMTITLVCYVITSLTFPIILLSSLIPKRQRPILDWSFIWILASLSIICDYYLLLRYAVVNRGTSLSQNIAAVLWINMASSCLSVLYFTYRERFSDRLMVWLKGRKTWLKALIFRQHPPVRRR